MCAVAFPPPAPPAGAASSDMVVMVDRRWKDRKIDGKQANKESQLIRSN